ncbi:MAG: DUF1559 domain-containing protein, partial [Planctomycetota bacterium]
MRCWFGGRVGTCTAVLAGAVIAAVVFSSVWAQPAAAPPPETLLPANAAVYLGFDGSNAHWESFKKTAAYEALYESGLADVGMKVVGWALARGGPQAEVIGAAVRSVLDNGLSVAFTAGEPGSQPAPWAAVVAHRNAALREPVAAMLKSAAQGAFDFQVVERSGRSILLGTHRANPALTIGLWTEGPHLVLVGGFNAVESGLKVATGAAPNITSDGLWAKVRQQRGFEVTTACWLNLETLAKQFGPMPLPLPPRPNSGAPVTVADVLRALRVDNVRSITTAMGYKGKAIWTETTIDVPGEKRGLLALLGERPLSESDFPPLPAGASSLLVSRLDWSRGASEVLEIVRSVAGIASPDGEQQFERQLRSLNDALQFDLKTELFGALGDVTAFYGDPNAGLFGLGIGLAISVRNAQTLRQTVDVITQHIAQAGGPNLVVDTSKRRGRMVTSLQFTGTPFTVAYTVDSDWFVLGLSPQAVEAFLLRKDGKLPRWEMSEEVRQAVLEVPQGYSAISISDPRPTIQAMIGMAPFLINVVRAALATPNNLRGAPVPPRAPAVELPISPADIPPAELVTRPLFANVSVRTVSEDGIRWVSRTSLPAIPLLPSVGGGGSVAAVGVLTALLLPAVQQARQAARRTASKNNLKQLGLAMHNFHEVYRHFPQGTVPNAQLPPHKRLSWVVPMLPFLDRARLFEQIDRNAAWDAPANQRFARMGIEPLWNPGMPDSTRFTRDGFATTHYVGIAGVGKDAATLPVGHKRAGVFGYDRKLRIRDVLDGTSNTIAITEASKVGPWAQGGPVTIRALTTKPYINGA